MDISARFADKTFSPDPSQYSTEITDIGKVYLPKRGVSYAKEVKLSLLKVLWMKKITVTGVYALQ